MDKQRLHEIQRGQVLRYLAQAGFRPVTPKMLLYHLRDMRYATTTKTLYFHLHYLADKGYIDLEMKQIDVGEEEQVLAVKITSQGVDALDRRAKGDPGVRF